MWMIRQYLDGEAVPVDGDAVPVDDETVLVAVIADVESLPLEAAAVTSE